MTVGGNGLSLGMASVTPVTRASWRPSRTLLPGSTAQASGPWSTGATARAATATTAASRSTSPPARTRFDGVTTFSVSHYYSTPGNTRWRDRDRRRRPAGREDSAASLTVAACAEGRPRRASDAGRRVRQRHRVRVRAQGYSPDNSAMSYDWKVYDGNGDLTAEYTGSTVQLHGRKSHGRT